MSGSLQTIQINQTVNSGLVPVPGIALSGAPLNSDYLLAQAAARGATSALGELYCRHNQRVYAVCLQMTQNSADAEDLTQEVFIHLLRKIGSFRGESQFTTWLHRLTVNMVLMHFRRPSVRRERQIIDSRGAEVFSWNRTSSGTQVVNQMALESALARLPAGCRSVFVLFDIEGRNHDEIAHLLGCSVGTSKSQLHRARAKLRRLLRSRRL